MKPSGILAAAVLASALHPARAAERRFELVPNIGFRGGATLTADLPARPTAEANPSVSFGLALDVSLSPDTWFEAFFDHQTLEFSADPARFGASRFNVGVTYLQFGASYGPAQGTARPYVTVAAGLTHFSADGGSVSGAVGFSGSIGAGLRLPISERLAFRLEGRGYATLSNAEVAVACGAGCVVRFEGQGWYQFAASAGLAIRL